MQLRHQGCLAVPCPPSSETKAIGPERPSSVLAVRLVCHPESPPRPSRACSPVGWLFACRGDVCHLQHWLGVSGAKTPVVTRLGPCPRTREGLHGAGRQQPQLGAGRRVRGAAASSLVVGVLGYRTYWGPGEEVGCRRVKQQELGSCQGDRPREALPCTSGAAARGPCTPYCARLRGGGAFPRLTHSPPVTLPQASSAPVPHSSCSHRQPAPGTPHGQRRAPQPACPPACVPGQAVHGGCARGSRGQGVGPLLKHRSASQHFTDVECIPRWAVSRIQIKNINAHFVSIPSSPRPWGRREVRSLQP